MDHHNIGNSSQNTVGHHIDTELKNHSYTLSSVVASFATRTVKVIVLFGGTILFPATSLAMGFYSIYRSCTLDIPLSIKLRMALASAMIPLPLIGSFLFYHISNNGKITTLNLFEGENKAPIKKVHYAFMSIPFYSSYLSMHGLLSLYVEST